MAPSSTPASIRMKTCESLTCRPTLWIVSGPRDFFWVPMVEPESAAVAFVVVDGGLTFFSTRTELGASVWVSAGESSSCCRNGGRALPCPR